MASALPLNLTAPFFTLHLLGPFEARIEGEPLPRLRSRKGAWLLALLALRGGGAVRREWLAEILWPDALPADASTSLRQTLADLRRALGPAADRLLRPDGRTLAFDLTGADFDVPAFDRAAASADLAVLNQAVVLYRGPLLEGCGEPWVLPEREARRLAYLRALRQLAEGERRAGLPAASAVWLRRAAAADPLGEENARLLMQALADSGDPAAAAAAYHDLRRRLREDANSRPARETAALAERIRTAARQTSVTLRHPRRAGSSPPWPGRLPHALSSLVGREEASRALRALLAAARLVTLTGPGGVGKTRLALDLARDGAAGYADGVVFVDVAAFGPTGSVAEAVTEALGLDLADRVPSPAHRAGVLDVLCDFLAPRELLLLLDNCEVLLGECRALAQALLATAPSLQVLATSRERFGLPGEQVWLVPPLPLCAGRETEEEAPAVRLLRARLAAVRPGADAGESEPLRRICAAVEGLPLALELAAGLADLLSLDEIAALLEDRGRLLALEDSERPARHRSLRTAVESSLEGLLEAERRLFRSLAVFSGGFTVQAVEAICADGTAPASCVAAYRGPTPASPAWRALQHLVRRSLVELEHPRDAPAAGPLCPSRYRLLLPLRQLAVEQLARAGEEPGARRRHARFVLRLAEEAAAALNGPDQRAWLARLDAESPELRAALEYSLADGETGGIALRLANALGRWWQIRGAFTEGRGWLARVLAAPERDGSLADRAARAGAGAWAALLAVYQGDYPASRRAGEEALRRWRELADPAGEAGALGVLGVAAKDQGQRAAARQLFAESAALYRAAGDAAGEAGALGYLGILAAEEAQLPAARAFYEQSLALRRRSGDRWGVAASLNNLGLAAWQAGESGQAEVHLTESLAIRRELGDRRCMAISLNALGLLLCQQGDLAGARQRFRESLQLARETGDRRSIAFSLEAFARLATAERDDERAGLLAGAAAALRARVGAPLDPSNRRGLERDLQPGRERLGKHAFAAACDRGRALDVEVALALAIGWEAGAGTGPPGGQSGKE